VCRNWLLRATAIASRLLIFDEIGEGTKPNIMSQIGNVIRRLIVLLVAQKLQFVRSYADPFVTFDRESWVPENDIAGFTDALIKRLLAV